jgi:purine-binding chemotaxis protein CheW
MANVDEPQDPLGHDNAHAMEDYVASFFDGLDCDAAIADIFSEPVIKKAALIKKAVVKKNPKAKQATEQKTIKNAKTSIGVDSHNSIDLNAVTVDAPLALPQTLIAEPLCKINSLEKMPSAYTAAALTNQPKKINTPLLAEKIPADTPLKAEQKVALQKLLDASMTQGLVNNALFDGVNPPVVNHKVKANPSTLKTNVLTQAIHSLEMAFFDAPTPIQPALLDKVKSIPAPTIKSDNLIAPSPEDVLTVARVNVEAKIAVEPEREVELTLPPTLDFRAHWHNQRPDWAGNYFDVLLFSCRGVTLAIPLISLGHIYWQTEPLNQLPHLPSWVLGVKSLSTQKLKIIDAGAYFLPLRAATLCAQAPMHLIAFADSDWAFAVDSVANPLRIALDDVQWRGLNGDNPWLAGAIKKPMCVVIDTPALLLHLDAPKR